MAGEEFKVWLRDSRAEVVRVSTRPTLRWATPDASFVEAIEKVSVCTIAGNTLSSDGVLATARVDCDVAQVPG